MGGRRSSFLDSLPLVEETDEGDGEGEGDAAVGAHSPLPPLASPPRRRSALGAAGAGSVLTGLSRWTRRLLSGGPDDLADDGSHPTGPSSEDGGVGGMRGVGGGGATADDTPLLAGHGHPAGGVLPPGVGRRLRTNTALGLLADLTPSGDDTAGGGGGSGSGGGGGGGGAHVSMGPLGRGHEAVVMVSDSGAVWMHE
jgi:hypothetical protein